MKLLYEIDKIRYYNVKKKYKLLMSLRAVKHIRELRNYKYYVIKEPFLFPSYIKQYKEIVHMELTENIGIMMTGVIDYKSDFTFNTLRLYRKLYPNITIVLSTWEGQLTEMHRRILSDLNIGLVEQKDIYCSMDKGHMANQIMAGRAGIEQMKKLGVDYALKTRTDIRFDKHDFLLYFNNMMCLYPRVVEGQKDRLLSVSFDNNLVNIPFHMSDLNWFSSITELEKMYELGWRTAEEKSFLEGYELDAKNKYNAIFWKLKDKSYTRHAEEKVVFDELNMKYLMLNSEEVLFCKNYVAHYYEIPATYDAALDCYIQFVRDCCIIIDQDEVGGRFNKTFISKYPIGIGFQTGRITHSYWVDMQVNRYKDREKHSVNGCFERRLCD